MSVELPIRTKMSIEGEKEVYEGMDSVFAVMRGGQNISTETYNNFVKLRKEMYAKRTALMMLRYGYLQTHPTMMLFTRAMSTVASVARTAVGIMNSYNLMLLTLKNRGSELASSQHEVEIATRAVQDLENQGLKDSEGWVKAKENLNEVTDRFQKLQKDVADETNRTNIQLGLLALTATATAIPAGSKLYDSFNDLDKIIKSTKGAFGTLAGVLGSPIVWAGIVVAGLAISAYLYSIGEDFDKVNEKANNIFKDFDKQVTSAFDAFNKAMDEFMTAAIEGNIDKLGKTAPIQILAIFGRLTVLILELIGRLTVALLAAIGKLIVVGLVIFGKLVWEGLVALGKAVYDALDATWKWLVNAIKGIVEDLWKWLKGGWEWFSGILGKVWEDLVGIASDLWNRITDTIKGIANAAWTWLSDGWKTLSGALETIWNGLKGVAKTVWDGITATIKSAINGVIYLINQLIGAINSIKMTFPDWVPLLGGKTFGFNIAPISYLQKGGIVEGPTLAMLGERGREAVIPLDRGGVGGVGKTINIGAINVYATGKTQAREISRELVLELNRYIRWS